VRNVLVTGGAGFIGCNFVRFLLATEPWVRIVTLDALTYAGSLDNLADIQDPTRHTFVRGDTCDQDLVVATLRDHGIDTVVNFAAETHVDRSIAEGAPFLRTNVLGAFSLLEAARKVWLEEGMMINLPNRLFRGRGRSEPVDEIRSEDDPGSPFKLEP